MGSLFGWEGLRDLRLGFEVSVGSGTDSLELAHLKGLLFVPNALGF